MNTKIERRYYRKAVPFTVVEKMTKPDIEAFYSEKAEKSLKIAQNARERAITAYLSTPTKVEISAPDTTTFLERVGAKLLSIFLDIKFH